MAKSLKEIEKERNLFDSTWSDHISELVKLDHVLESDGDKDTLRRSINTLRELVNIASTSIFLPQEDEAQETQESYIERRITELKESGIISDKFIDSSEMEKQLKKEYKEGKR